MKTKSISRTLRVGVFAPSILIVLILAGAWTWVEYSEMKSGLSRLEQEVLSDSKREITEQVQSVVDFSRFKRSQVEQRVREDIRNRVGEAHALAQALWMDNRNRMDRAQLESLVREALRALRFDHDRGYYFATRLDGVEMLFTDKPELEGRNLLSLQDAQGRPVIRDMIDIARSQGEGFYEYAWSKPNAEGLNFRKLAYVKFFEPFGWFIGTGKYLDDMEADIRREVLERIRSIHFGDDGYIYVIGYDGQFVSHIDEKYIGASSLQEVDPNGVHITENLLRIGKENGSGFLSYVWNKPSTGLGEDKVAYVQALPEWGWVVGAGVYLQDVHAAVAATQARFIAITKTKVIVSALLAAIILSVWLLWLRYATRSIHDRVEAFSRFFQNATLSSSHIGTENLLFDEFKSIANNANAMLDERVRYEQALRGSEERYRAILDHAGLGIALLDEEGRFVQVNTALCEMTGYCARELLGQCWAGVTHPDDVQINVALVQELNAGSRKSAVLEKRYRTKKGDTIWVNVTVTRLQLAGNDKMLISVSENITERKRVFSELSKLTEELTAIFDNVPATIWYKDTNNNYIRVSNSAAKLAGCDVDEINGHSAEDIFPSEAAQHYRDDLEVIHSGQPKLGITESVTAKDGSVVWVNMDKLPVRDKNGNITGVLAFAIDITKRRQAEEALKESEERYALALRGTNDGIWDWDLRSGQVYFSQRWKEIIGYTQEELTNTVDEWMGRVHPEDVHRVRQANEQCIRGETSGFEVEYRLLHKDGNYRWILGRGASLKEEQGAVVRLAGALTDITERRIMQEAMVQSEKMMSVGGLAAGMAHEINNPLSGILQGVQVLQRRLGDGLAANVEAAQRVGCPFEAITAYMQDRGILAGLENIRESGMRAAQVVKSMLEFSRRSESHNSPADLNLLLDKSVELCATDYDLKKMYDFRKIHIEREYAPDLPEVPCSKTQIQQVLMNLLRNAAHALRGSPAPRITLRSMREAGSVRIEVEDNGPGMDEVTRRKIFEPFFTTKPVGEGDRAWVVGFVFHHHEQSPGNHRGGFSAWEGGAVYSQPASCAKGTAERSRDAAVAVCFTTRSTAWLRNRQSFTSARMFFSGRPALKLGEGRQPSQAGGGQHASGHGPGETVGGAAAQFVEGHGPGGAEKTWRFG